jgi:hypothetical protein
MYLCDSHNVCVSDSKEIKSTGSSVSSIPLPSYELKTQTCQYCAERHPMMVRIPMKQEDLQKFRDQHPCCWLPAVRDSESLASVMLEDQSQMVNICQRHIHSATCYKYYNALRKSHPEMKKCCRFHLARVLSATTTIDEGKITMRRAAHFINNYNAAMLFCCRCNHDISTLWGTDSNAMASMYYITNYVTKKPINLLSRLPILQTCLAKHKEIKDSGGYHNNSEDEQAGLFLAMIHNQTQKLDEISAPMIMSSLSRLPEVVSSHEFVSLLLWPFIDDWKNPILIAIISLKTRCLLNGDTANECSFGDVRMIKCLFP